MKAIIIDDEAMARIFILQFSNLYPQIQVVEEFSDAVSAIKYLNKNQVDLVFLDIHLPDFTGFDIIQALKKPPQIILITSDKNFAIEAFEYDCIVDYLVKPISIDRFEKAIQKLKSPNKLSKSETDTIDTKNLIPSSDEFYINIDRRLIKINFSSVNVIEANGDYILIKTDKENYKVHSTLKKIEEKLPRNTFLKVHRSYIINIRKIVDIEDNSVLISKNVIPVSRCNRPKLMQQLNLL